MLKKNVNIALVIQLTEVELTTGSITFAEPTVWAIEVRESGSFFVSE